MSLLSLLIKINVFLLNKVLFSFLKIKLTETIPWKHTFKNQFYKGAFLSILKSGVIKQSKSV